MYLYQMRSLHWFKSICLSTTSHIFTSVEFFSVGRNLQNEKGIAEASFSYNCTGLIFMAMVLHCYNVLWLEMIFILVLPAMVIAEGRRSLVSNVDLVSSRSSVRQDQQIGSGNNKVQDIHHVQNLMVRQEQQNGSGNNRVQDIHHVQNVILHSRRYSRDVMNVFQMLPKGQVPPSRPSPIHNNHPSRGTNQRTAFPQRESGSPDHQPQFFCDSEIYIM